MASAPLDNPSGFHLIGPPLQTNVYVKTTAEAIYPGEAVSVAAAGGVAPSAAGDKNIVGVALGYATATDTEILVADHPHQQYYIQADSTAAAADVGLACDILATAGNATYLKALQEVDISSKLTTEGDVKILGKHPADTWSTYTRLRVVINQHYQNKLTGI